MARNLKSKRIVIKIGTNTITDRSGMLDLRIINNLVSQIAKIKNRRNIVVITSGAIGAGMRELGLKDRPIDVVGKQVCAAVGQGILMATYHSMFQKHNIKIAQILLTYNDLNDEETYKNLKNSINRLFELGVIPIMNENDPISINEIGPSFGDNDALSAMISKKIKTDLLVMLTNVDGLYDKDPGSKGAVLIKEVKNISKKIKTISGKASKLGIGGMKTKVIAAKKATKAGTNVVIANGRKEDVLVKIVSGEDIGTIFYPKNK